MKLMMTAALLLALAGCAPTEVTKPGASQSDVQQAVNRCKFEASRRDGVPWPDEVNLCLRGYGFAVNGR